MGRPHHYLHVGECILPLHVLAVACTISNKALQKHYGMLWIVTVHYVALWDITEASLIVMKHYGSFMELLRNITKPLWKISILAIS